ncbi:MAG: NAD(P)-dependent oxidoreductase [Acidimicrobiales bacterium]
MTKPRVGFIGLGSQGAPMARRIVEEGFPLSIWARRPDSVAPFADTAAAIAASPADLAERSDIVCLCVVADSDVEDVLRRDDGVFAGMARGGIVVVHSTIDPDSCARLAAHGAAQGIALIDAPVSGGGIAAAERRLLMMVGGNDQAVAVCRPVFESFANPIVHLGPVGSGQVAKLMNNLVFTAHIAVAAETFALAEGLGVSRAAMNEVLARGSGASFAASVVGASGSVGLAGAAPLLRKDLDTILDLARRRAVHGADVLASLAEAALDGLVPGP